MEKIVEIIRFYSLNEINNYILKGNDYPNYHVWCYDVLLHNFSNIGEIDYNKDTFINILGKKIGIVNLQQQINCFRLTTKKDILFAPFIKDVFFLAVLKILRIYNSPIIAISHNAYVPNQKNILKRCKRMMIRNINLIGIDKILFLNERMYNHCNSFKRIQESHSYLHHWGVDYSFFNSYSVKQQDSPKNDFILSLGGTNRDFKILIEAFKNINFKLKVIPKKSENIPPDIDIPKNAIISSSIPNLYSYSLIRAEYYNCFAVAIPLLKEDDYSPSGSTILFEAFAMGKAVITTKNVAYPFDVEVERIGLNVNYGDVAGWENAVNYLIDHPQEVKEMGNRAKQLCKNIYNYELFSQEILGHLKKMDDNDKFTSGK